MRMHFLDWLLLLVPLLLVFGIGAYAHRFMKSVADFMTGRRLAGPYLLAVAQGELQAGAAVFIAMFEMIGKSGFTVTWWQSLTFPVFIIIAISGFVGFRFRETRAMTLAQFFEIRYNKSFRVFTGGLGFLAGILNFGVIPAIGARFFTYYLGLPETLGVAGFSLPTFIPIMAFCMTITVFLCISGGLITVMVTDCVEGILSQLFYVVIIAALLLMFSWDEISHVLMARPAGESLLNPFDAQGIKDFNIWFVLMGLFATLYGTGAWQNAAAYKSAGITPHQGVMGGILGRWRELGKASVVTLLAVCAMTFLQHPDFSGPAASAKEAISAIGNERVQGQMEIPVALSHLLPIGIKGMLCAILLMGVFGGDSTHLHSWGSIFVQDVLVPLRKKPFGPKQHILALRLAIIGVALFAFCFGCLLRQTEYVFMWWSVTTAIYVGGAGAAVIGGLYWKKGTAAGAWAALIVGSTLAVGGIIARQACGTDFPLNGVQISFFSSLSAITTYVVVSLLTCREDFNMDRMLHRGKYAKVTEQLGEQAEEQASRKSRFTFGRLIGIDENFSRSDKWIARSLFGWSVFWFAIFLVGTLWNLVAPWPASVWSAYWRIAGIGIPVVVTVVTGLWFTWGGVRDVRNLFRLLASGKVNHLDDGTVVNHQNLDESILDENAAKPQAPAVPR